MKKNQKGFSVIEVLLVLVIIGLVVGIGWYTLNRNNHHRSATNSAQPTKAKTYTDSSKLYTLSYPENWIVKEAADCCEGAPKDHTQVPRMVTFIPPGKSDIHGYGVQIQADKTDALATLIERGWATNKHTPEAKNINGSDTAYVKVSFNGDAENYVDHNYLIKHNEASVFVSFREKYYHQSSAADWTAAQDMQAFSAILDSITFTR
jgi:prepilin-type N-terminal cleavage/methylation domain-containing protein